VKAHHVRRPTEDAALHAVSRSPRPTPSLPDLFDALQHTHATGDRYGVRLVQGAIARTVGRTEAVR
jgi:hypothetical protein